MKFKHFRLLLSFGFDFGLRPYSKVAAGGAATAAAAHHPGNSDKGWAVTGPPINDLKFNVKQLLTNNNGLSFSIDAAQFKERYFSKFR